MANYDNDSELMPGGEDLDLITVYRESLKGPDYAPLSPEETKALVLKARAGDTTARDRLITSLLPLGLSLLRRYRKLDPSDVLGVANETIVTAVDRALVSYDVEQSGGLLNYVKTACLHTLGQASDAQQSVVRIPPQSQHERRQLRKGKPLPQRTQQRIATLHGADRSLEDEVSSKGDSDPLHLLETLADPHASIPEIVVARGEGLRLLYAIVNARLTPRQADVMRLLFGLSETGEQPWLTVEEVARTLGIPQTTVKGLKQAALANLRTVPGLRTLLRLLVTPYRPYGEMKIATAPITDPKSLRVPVKNPNQKFSEKDIHRIRLLKSIGRKQIEIAKIVGCSPATVSMVLNKRIWKAVA